MRRLGGCFEHATEIVLEIRFGTGGDDAKAFVSELFSAYLKYAAKKHFTTTILQEDAGHIVAQIEGREVWKAFSHETGQHCIQRVPKTERGGRRHTSIASVAVLPIRRDLSSPLPDSEVEVIAQRGTQKAGGQKANKTSSAIRATHVPTGISVFIQNERSQSQNKQQALDILAARVNDVRRAKEDAAYARFRKETLGDGRRGSKIRTYNLIDHRAVDHRIGRKTSQVESVLNGDFELLM